jgi:hypothetical protein
VLVRTTRGAVFLTAGFCTALPCAWELAPASFCQIAAEAGAALACSKLACSSAIETLRAKHNWGFFIVLPLSYLFKSVTQTKYHTSSAMKLSTTPKMAQIFQLNSFLLMR